jgi:hypothetical protein
MTRLTRILGTTIVALALGGCGGVAYQQPVPSDTRSGKCAGPDYNAPNCIYLF